MLVGYPRQEKDLPPLPGTVPALLRLRGEGEVGDRVALRLIDRTTETRATATYFQLYRRSAWVARELAGHGVCPGERVVLFLETALEFYYGLFGAILQGALPVAVAPPLTPHHGAEARERLREAVHRLGARAVFSSPACSALAAQVAADAGRPVLANASVGEASGTALPGEQAGAHDPVVLQYTSGTRGDPKPLALSHQALLTNLRAVGDAFAVEEGDIGLSWLPLYHDMGLQSAFFSLGFAMPLVVMPPAEFLRRPAAWLQAISRYRVTHSPAPPFGYSYAAERIADEELAGVDLGRWRVAMCGSDMIDPAALERFADRFAPFSFRPAALMAAYGLAENTVAVSFAAPGTGLRAENAPVGPTGRAVRVASVGRPIAGHALRVVDDEGCEVPDGSEGEIEVSGPSHMLGYLGDTAASRQVTRGGWLRTGDLGFVRDGELYVTGIKEDQIVLRGQRYHPHPIEAAAATVAGVRRGGVVAFAMGAEKLITVAEVESPALVGSAPLGQQVAAAIDETLGVAVDRVVLVPRGSVPRTTSGKLRRAECRRRFEAGLLEAPPATRR